MGKFTYQLLGLSTLLFSGLSQAQIIETNDLKRYCNQDGVHRQTVLYLDQSIISKTDALWYRDIVNKLKFLPGEKVQVVTVKSGGPEVELAWEACYPSYTPVTYKKLKEKTGLINLFTGDVDDKLKSDQGFFNKNFQSALAHPLIGTKHDTKPRFTKDTFPMKKLVEALYYDAKRMEFEKGVSRVVMFSDMIEKSNLLDHNRFEPHKSAEQVSERFPMFLSYASFSIYGINYTHGESDLNAKMERFWRQYLLKSGASIAHYGSQLVLHKNTDMFELDAYDGYLVQSDGRKVAAKMRLGYFDNGELTNSVLTLGDEYLPLAGSISTSGKNVEVKASITDSTFKGFEKKDVLNLKGSPSMLKGVIGARDDRTVDEKGEVYRFSIELTKESD